MKKSIKLIIAIGITIILYIAFYWFLVKNASPEEYAKMLYSFVLSLIFAFVAIPIGAGIIWFLQKKNVEQNKIFLITLAIAFIYGYLVGWLSLTGMIIGQFIVEKDE